MKRLKGYEHLNRLCKRGLWKYVVFAAVITVFSVVMVFINYNQIDDGFLSFLGLIIALDAFFWLPCLFKYESRKAKFKKFTDDELVRFNEAIPNIDPKKRYLVIEDALIIREKEFVLIPIRDILWIYNEHMYITHKTLGTVTGTSEMSHTIIKGKNKKILCITSNVYIGNLAHLREELSLYRRGIFYGYSEELNYMFCKDFKRMLAASEAADAEMLHEPDNAEMLE